MAIRGYRIPQRRKTKVLYYDDSTLLGTKRYFRGKDVLHPSLTVPSKTDKTFVGWATTNSVTTLQDTLLANGEPLSLYAIYVPNSQMVASGSFSGTDYTRSVWNTDYMSGEASAGGSTPNGTSFSCNFGINWRRYQSASLTVRTAKNEDGHAHFLSGSVNGVTFTAPYSTSSAQTTVTPNNGNNNLSADLRCEADVGWANGAIGVLDVTLSNPQAWV